MKRVYLDGKTNSTLDWSHARKEVETSLGPIIWDLDLGLFAGLKRGLEDQTQFLSLSLSLEHFRDAIWKEFKDRTHSVCVYEGSVDFSRDFKWDDRQWANCVHWLHTQGVDECCSDRFAFEKHAEGPDLLRLFCRDTCVEYIQLLANRMPDGLEVSVRLHTSDYSLAHEAQLFHGERYERLTILKENTRIQESPQANIALCLPPLEMCRQSHYQGIEEALQVLMNRKIPYRLIPENHLIMEWDGLDHLLVSPNGISINGKRKLQGFQAAGGNIIMLDNAMDALMTI